MDLIGRIITSIYGFLNVKGFVGMEFLLKGKFAMIIRNRQDTHLTGDVLMIVWTSILDGTAHCFQIKLMTVKKL